MSDYDPEVIAAFSGQVDQQPPIPQNYDPEVHAAFSQSGSDFDSRVAARRAELIKSLPEMLYVGGRQMAGGLAHGVGTLVDVGHDAISRTNTGLTEGSYANKFSQPFAMDPVTTAAANYDPSQEQMNRGVSRWYDKLFGTGPGATTLKERIPQATEAIGTATAGIGGVGGAITGIGERSAARAAAAAVDETHPLAGAAKQEAAAAQEHVAALEKAGVTVPEREITPQQRAMNDLPREDLDLPKNARVTSTLLDAADKRTVSPAFEAAKATQDFNLGPKYQAAISKIDLSKIEPEWRPPTTGTLDGARSVELSKQLRSVARGLNSDAENFNLTYAERQAAKQSADAHYQAAKVVEGGYREAATKADAVQAAKTGVPTNARTAVADNWEAARLYKAKLEAWRGTLDGDGNVVAPKAKRTLGDDPISPQMERAVSWANQAPEMFKGTRVTAPTVGPVRKAAAALAPAAAAAAGGYLGGPVGAAAGEFAGKHAADAVLRR